MKSWRLMVCVVLLVAAICSIAAPALASDWEDRYGTKVLQMCGTNPSTHVRNLQTDLKTVLGISLEIDGLFGDETRKAVILFQRHADLTADGIVKDQTKRALHRAVL